MMERLLGKEFQAAFFGRRPDVLGVMGLFEYQPGFLQKRRVQEAQRQLTEKEESVGEIAVAAGFHDQSHFTRQFRRVTGMPPLAYRKRFR